MKDEGCGNVPLRTSMGVCLPICIVPFIQQPAKSGYAQHFHTGNLLLRPGNLPSCSSFFPPPVKSGFEAEQGAATNYAPLEGFWWVPSPWHPLRSRNLLLSWASPGELKCLKEANVPNLKVSQISHHLLPLSSQAGAVSWQWHPCNGSPVHALVHLSKSVSLAPAELRSVSPL